MWYSDISAWRWGVVIFSEKFIYFYFCCLRSNLLESKKSYYENLRCLCSQLLHKCSNVGGRRHCMLSLYGKFPIASCTIHFCAHVIELLNITECNIFLPQKPLRQYKNFKPHLLGSGFLSVVPVVEFHFAIRKTLCCLNAWRDKFELCHSLTYSLPYLSAFALCCQHRTPVCPAIVETCPPTWLHLQNKELGCYRTYM